MVLDSEVCGQEAFGINKVSLFCHSAAPPSLSLIKLHYGCFFGRHCSQIYSNVLGSSNIVNVSGACGFFNLGIIN